MTSDDVRTWDGDRRATLQINLCPADYPHARVLLHHQIRRMRPMVDEVLLSLDLNRPPAFDKVEWEERMRPMQELLDDVRRDHGVRVEEIDYSPEARRTVADYFFGGVEVPLKDFRGRPFFPYLQPLMTASTPWVFHIDSDMMLGGTSTTWIEEAQDLLLEHPEYIVASPLPGPPRADGTVLRQPTATYVEPAPAITITRMSSRVHFLNIQLLRERLAPIPLAKAPLHGRLWTRRQHNPPYEKLEVTMEKEFARRGLERIDFLGANGGLWGLHPPFRSPAFYDRLESLVAAVEADDVPDAQRGDYDVNDSMLDWTDARKAIRNERIRVMLGR
jgi:hypothetical protein